LPTSLRVNRVKGKILECVPNFSEGRDYRIIEKITLEIQNIKGVKLLHIDMGATANRTVVTFAGDPEAVIEAAFKSIRCASRLIDMRKHTGAHPRIGATDVCPLVPLKNMIMDEAVEYSHVLGKKIGEIGIPVYLYENSASTQDRKNLAVIRRGEYEGLIRKQSLPEWRPDFGPNTFNAKSGATVIGARDLLVAYNVNLETKDVAIANQIAKIIRESGYLSSSHSGQPKRIPGKLKAVRAIGWYIDEYGKAQVSTNLTNITITPLHSVFVEVFKNALALGTKVTGSEIIGMVPKIAMVEAGRHFYEWENDNTVTEASLINLAIQKMGLGEFKSFDPAQKIIEYLLD